MAQLFTPKATTIFRRALLLVAIAVVAASALGFALARSDRVRGVGRTVPQPVPFSHALHVEGIGIDCRYCHNTVEHAAYAGMPTAQTCIGCHGPLPAGAAYLAPVWASYRTGEPLLWGRVHDLPDHARFHHGIHVSSGVPCATCHGPVESMAQAVQTAPLSMSWCLDCHRDAAVNSRLHGDVSPPSDIGRVNRLTDCSICHY